MHKSPSSVKDLLCRIALKSGSLLFVLFLTFFMPAAPVIAQIGSALFIFFVMVLSPLLPQTTVPEKAEEKNLSVLQQPNTLLAASDDLALLTIETADQINRSRKYHLAAEIGKLHNAVKSAPPAAVEQLHQLPYPPGSWFNIYRCSSLPVRGDPRIAV